MEDNKGSGIYNLYSDLFKHLKDKEITLLELGIKFGDSLEWFENYFPKGKIVGIDTNVCKHYGERTRTILANQNDSLALQKIGNEHGLFDIIVDDCSHYGQYTQISFDFLWEYLKPGGFYILEDWLAGQGSPQFRGMDDVVSNITKNFLGWKIESITILKSFVIIKKL